MFFGCSGVPECSGVLVFQGVPVFLALVYVPAMTKTTNASVNEFSTLIRNMDCFLTCKQCPKDAEVEELHQKIILKHRQRNVIMFDYFKIGAPGCQQRIERCSVLTAKSLKETNIETNSSQAVGVTIETITLSLPLNNGGMMLNTQETVSMGKTKG